MGAFWSRVYHRPMAGLGSLELFSELDKAKSRISISCGNLWVN